MKNIKNKNGDGGTLIYDAADWKAGLGPQGRFGTSVFARQTTDNGFSRLDSVDPFSTYGALSPGTLYSATATNNTAMTGYMTAFELTDNSTGLGVDSGGKIHQATVSGAAMSIINAGSFPHTITGTSPVGQDGIIYRHNYNTASVVSFFYSYYNNSQWNVGIYRLVAAAFDGTDDFMSVRPTTPLTTADSQDADQRTAPHTFEIGADGVLYIGSGRYLHAYDGNVGAAYGTFFTRVLTLPQGFQITAIKKLNNILLIAGDYYQSASGTGQALTFTWDYVSSDVTGVIPLEDNHVSALFLWKGSPTVLTSGAIGRNGRVKIKVISGNTVTKKADFGAYADLPSNRGVVVIDDIIYMNAGGKLVTYGNKYEASSAINSVAIIGTGTSSGVLFWNEIQSCFAGSAGTQQFYNINNGHGAGTANAFAYAVPLPPMKIARLMEVRTEFYAMLSAGGTNGALTVQLSLDLNSSGTPTVINALSSVALPLYKRYTQDINGLQLNQQFTMIAPLISWAAGSGGSSPQISRLEIDYLLEDVPTVV